jgi:hypothetical protein
MASYIWNDAIKGNVYTAINERVVPKFKSQKHYEGINCGTVLKKDTTPTFPYVLIKRLQGTEVGQTLEKDGIDAILTTFQIEVFSNYSESVCENISNYIASIMTEKLRFTMVGEPFADYESTDEYRYIARYQRTIGRDDYMTW